MYTAWNQVIEYHLRTKKGQISYVYLFVISACSCVGVYVGIVHISFVPRLIEKFLTLRSGSADHWILWITIIPSMNSMYAGDLHIVTFFSSTMIKQKAFSTLIIIWVRCFDVTWQSTCIWTVQKTTSEKVR